MYKSLVYPAIWYPFAKGKGRVGTFKGQLLYPLSMFRPLSIFKKFTISQNFKLKDLINPEIWFLPPTWEPGQLKVLLGIPLFIPMFTYLLSLLILSCTDWQLQETILKLQERGGGRGSNGSMHVIYRPVPQTILFLSFLLSKSILFGCIHIASNNEYLRRENTV